MESLVSYIEMREKENKQMEKFMRMKERSLKEKQWKNFEKYQNVRANLSFVQDNRENAKHNLMEKQDRATQNVREIKEKRQRDILLRQEKEQLKIMD